LRISQVLFAIPETIQLCFLLHSLVFNRTSFFCLQQFEEIAKKIGHMSGRIIMLIPKMPPQKDYDNNFSRDENVNIINADFYDDNYNIKDLLVKCL